jgi:tellurite resistance protein
MSEKKAIQTMLLVSGINDKDLLKRLYDFGIKSDTLAAVSLMPLVHVAWADGELDDKEKKGILDRVVPQGVYVGSEAYQLLDSWLSKKPDDVFFRTWSDYIHARKDQLDVDAFKALKNESLGMAEKIAAASGGFLKIGSVSEEEKKAMAELSAVFGS